MAHGLRQPFDTHVDGQGRQRLLVGHVLVERAHSHAGHSRHLADGHAGEAALQQNPNKGLLQGL